MAVAALMVRREAARVGEERTRAEVFRFYDEAFLIIYYTLATIFLDSRQPTPPPPTLRTQPPLSVLSLVRREADFSTRIGREVTSVPYTLPLAHVERRFVRARTAG